MSICRGEKEGTGAREVYCISQNQKEFNREMEASTISVDEEWQKATRFMSFESFRNMAIFEAKLE